MQSDSHQRPRLKTALPGPKAAALVERDRQAVSPSYTRDYPLVAERGEGCWIEDVDGNRFLDFTAGIAVTSTGHAHPEVVQAVTQQAQKLIHMSGTDFYYAPQIELAERLAALAPGSEPKRVFFTNSGTETIEAALKLARYHTRRQRVIAFYGAFHGRTYGSLAVGGSKALHQRGFGAMLPGVHRLPYDCSRAELELLLAQACPADEVAAIIVEPIQGEGGYRVPSREFLPMLRSVCDKIGALLVADEVQSGIGRTGRMFAVEHDGVVPDLLCLAKGIASGMPLGALVAPTRVMDWPPGSHASTFGGNPLSCRAALVTLSLVERQYMENASLRGDELQAGLAALAHKYPSRLSQPRGRGLMVAVDALAEGEPSAAQRAALVRSCFERGLLLLGCGPTGVRFSPPLCLSAAEVQTGLEIFAEAVVAGLRG